MPSLNSSNHQGIFQECGKEKGSRGFTEVRRPQKHTTQLEELVRLTQLPSQHQAGLAPPIRGSNQKLLRS